MWGYKDGCSLEQRRQFVEKILKKYPDRVPVNSLFLIYSNLMNLN